MTSARVMRWRSSVLPALCIALTAVFLAACGGAEPTGLPTATQDAPAEPTYTTIINIPVETGSDPVSSVQGETVIDDEHFGAATASLAERIFFSDVIVRASLVSASDGLLRFRAVEYLKGTGEAEFSVRAETAGRNTAWDGREAVLFLDLPETQGAAGTEFRFADTTTFDYGLDDVNPDRYLGDRSEGFTVDASNPVWLPAESGAQGASGNADANPSFIADYQFPDAGDQDAVTLAELRAEIAWVDGGDGVDGYDFCIRRALAWERYVRDWIAYYGSMWETPEFEQAIPSGAAEGTIIHDYGPYHHSPAYDKFWLSGSDAHLFRSLLIDDDNEASNGYNNHVVTARPLPAGEYTFNDHGQAHFSIPCDYKNTIFLEWLITVTAPTGTIHEAFFDPVTLTAGGVGANATEGALKPAAFTVGSQSVELESLAWSGGSAVLTLDTHVSLSGHALDFLALNGSVSLSLGGSAATASGNTLTWTVATQPWQAGDKLMLRIRQNQSEEGQ